MTYHRGNDDTVAATSPPRPDQPATVGAQARAVIAEYDLVRTWSDPPTRQRELSRLGAIAVDLLRGLGGEQDERSPIPAALTATALHG